MGSLVTCSRDLQTVMHEAIKYYDFSVVYGYRDPELQFELFKKGRKEFGGKWIVDKADQVVTFKDGTEKKSKHNADPSRAVDIIPYPTGWIDKKQFYYMAGVVMTVSDLFYKQNKIEKPLVWGGSWDWVDLPHFQI